MNNLFSNPMPTGANKAPFNFAPSTHDSSGLRQRRPTDTNRHLDSVDHTKDENSNPNNSSRGIPSYGKWDGANSKVRAPPRVFLAASGKSALRNATAMSVQQAPPPTNEHVSDGDSHSQALTVVPNTKIYSDESSLWVVAYGFRTEAQFRALIHRLESCGTITSSRGGLSTGRTKTGSDNGSNWVAVRYSSALAAHKAMCQNGGFVSVGGSTMVIGVMSLSDSNAADKLGIDIYGTHSTSHDVVIRSVSRGINEHPMTDDSDLLLGDREDGMDVSDRATSGLDSICGKVLAWFFMW
ncbi:hypothetical protein HJC23_008764 [Cyclotella cryptica]|uniref:RRM Nup35-type domain-containing protein n=1 Tax=Cyclotella cryptica TaxID=29204 RepID=A0ABD3PDP0_9STRA|eukprot:CCRYP_015666-RA/>CCRYP_015666-RA protein AED:0.18 eAED:0.17 QI:0/-1/0/1/-1/1/1/0/295